MKITRCVINGAYYYSERCSFPVQCVSDFLKLLKACSKEQRNIIEANLWTKLDTAKRYTKTRTGFDDLDDDIPF